MNSHLDNLIAAKRKISHNRIHLLEQRKRKISWLTLFVKASVTADYSFSSIKALPHECCDGKYRLALENTAASHLKLRSNVSYARGGTHGGVPLCHVVFRVVVIARPNSDFD